MQGKPARADVAPPQPPSGALRCPGPPGLQLAHELPRRSRRPPIKQKRDTKNGPSETDDRNVTSFNLRVMQICLVINLRTAQHSLSCAPEESRFFCTILSEKSATYQNPDLTLKRFEIRHDIRYLTRRKLKPRHRRMNSLKQRSLQSLQLDI
jgi:hypothetical protein